MARCEGINKSFERNSSSLNLEIIKEWNDQGYKIEHHGQRVDVLIFGESHHDLDHQRKQAELIGIIRPEYILHEGANAWVYDPDRRMYLKQEGRKFHKIDDIKPFLPHEFLSAAQRIGFKIIGCDLTYGECLEFGRRLSQIFPDIYQYDETEDVIKKSFVTLSNLEEDKNIIKYREKHMVKTIAKYQKESEKPLIIILGQAHGENIHQRKLLQRRKFGYVYIDQVS